MEKPASETDPGSSMGNTIDHKTTDRCKYRNDIRKLEFQVVHWILLIETYLYKLINT